MRKFIITLTLGLLSSLAWGQGFVTNFTVTNDRGNVVPGASVAVCTADPGTSFTPPCISLATTYTSQTLGTACSGTGGPISGVGCTNPGVADGHGNVAIFSQSGTFFLEIYGNGIVSSRMVITPGSPTGAVSSVFGRTGAVVAQSGDYTYTQIVTGIVATANGGTSLSSAGSVGNYLRSGGFNWTSSNLLAADLTGIVTVPHGGSGLSTATTNGIIFGNAAGNFGVTPAGGAGTLCLTEINGGVPTFGGCGLGGSSLVSACSPQSGTGVIRLCNTDVIGWRNFANSGDLTIGVVTSGATAALQFNTNLNFFSGVTGGTLSISATDNAGNITIQSGGGDASHNSGSVLIQGLAGLAAQGGGSVFIQSGNSTGTVAPGDINITAGQAFGAVRGGNIVITPGPGSPIGTIKLMQSIFADGSGYKHKRFGATTATAAVAFSTANTAYTWSTAFADANYTLTCTGLGATNIPVIVGTSAKAGAGFTITVAALTGAAASYSEMDCQASHD